MTPAAVVAGGLFWTKTLETTSTARFYAILAVVTLLTDPLANFIILLPGWSASFACLSRIQSYLRQEELQDPRSFSALSRRNSRRSSNSGSAGLPRPVIHLSGINVTMDLTGIILRNASIVVRAGQVTMIDGTVGCGKSTLLNVMLGEMPLRNGTATLSTRSIAVAGQKPWLLNKSIRLNIIGHKAFNATLYSHVVDICDLTVDFQQLPNGDETVVGSGGCQLSGGQKQRISIARALYVEARVTILDDPFSSLDHDTASLIRLKLFADGNATPNGRSLVMTTSMKQHLVDADTIYRVRADGFVVQVTSEQLERELEDLARNNRAGVVSSAESSANSPAFAEPPAVVPASGDDTDIQQETTSKKYSSYSVYKYFLQPAGVVAVIVWLVLNAFASLSERMPNVYIRIWLETHANDNRYYIGYALVCLAHPILNVLNASFFFWFVNTPTITKLHDNLVDATFGATLTFLVEEDTGSILNRFSSDLTLATQKIPGLILPAVWRELCGPYTVSKAPLT